MQAERRHDYENTRGLLMTEIQGVILIAELAMLTVGVWGIFISGIPPNK